MRRYACWVAFLGIMAGAWLSCRRSSADGGRVLFLSHLLTDQGVRSSPLRQAGPGGGREALYPVDSKPVGGALGNPLELDRSLDLGPVALRILFAPPRSEYAWDLDLPEDPVFRFGLGIVRDGRFDALPGPPSGEAGVEFIVRLEVDGLKKTVFQKQMDLPPDRDNRSVRYAPYRILLPAGGRKGRLILRTGGPKSAFAFWHDPAVYGRKPDESRLNVVLVSIDTLRADHVGAYGYKRPTTPNLDALARESAVFLNTFAPAPWTLPSHVSLLSGQNCLTHRVYYESDAIDPNTPLLAELLRDRGYACAAFTGAGFVSSSFGFSRGFYEFDQGQGALGSETLAAEAAKKAVGWLKTHADRPFFLFLHTYQVHHPYKAPPPYDTLFLGPDPKWRRWDFSKDHGGRPNIFKPLPESERQNIIGLYDGGIRYTDEALLKPLVETLKERGLLDRTLLIVTSDHGEEFFEHGGWAHTRAVYDESIKVPLIIRFPGGRWAGRRAPVVRLTDIAPTVLEALGIPFDEDRFDGRSLFPVLRGRESGDRAFSSEIADNVLGYRNPLSVAANSGKRKVILNGEFNNDYLSYFAVPPRPQPPLELYDLAADAAEKSNLIDRPTEADRALVGRAKLISEGMKKSPGRKADMTKALEDQLRALGYIR